MEKLCSLISELKAIDSRAFENGTSSHYIEVTSGVGETVISANPEGFVHLALQLLAIAESGHSGTHYHLDEVSMADTAEINVVFAIKHPTKA